MPCGGVHKGYEGFWVAQGGYLIDGGGAILGRGAISSYSKVVLRSYCKGAAKLQQKISENTEKSAKSGKIRTTKITQYSGVT